MPNNQVWTDKQKEVWGPTPPKKTGLTSEEIYQMRQLAATLTAEQIAQKLERPVATVRRFLEREELATPEMQGESRERWLLRQKLIKRHYWPNVKSQFSEENNEVEYFTQEWINWMEQFGDDVTHSEEIQLKDAITVDILINRSMVERNRALEYIKKLEIEIQKEQVLANPDEARIVRMEEQVNMTRATLGEYTNEYTRLLKEKNALHEDLKSTRDQRVKKIEDSETTFATYIKMLDSDDVRRRTGEEIELMRIAKERAKKTLSELHIFGDGKGDLPLLTPETYLEYKKKEEEPETKEEDKQ